MKKAALLALLFISFLQVRAQEFTGNEANKFVSGADKIFYTSFTKIPRYIHFAEPKDFNPKNPEQKFQNIYKLKQDYSYKLKSATDDRIGQTHYRYQVFYKNILMDGSEITAHIKNDKLIALSASLFLIDASAEPMMDKTKAIDLAIEDRQADVFMWELSDEEANIKVVLNSNTASYFPDAELVWFPEDLKTLKNWKLCYRMKIYAQTPLFHEQVYLDAQSGKVLFRENLLHDVNVTGTAETKYSGTKQIHTDSLSNGLYRLRDSSIGVQFITLNMNESKSYASAVDFIDSNNYWNNINPDQDEIATDAHWGAERTYHYFLDNFGRNSFDDNGAGIRSYVHYSSNYNNAFWNGYYMTYGDGNGTTFTPLVCLDVCGHEIGHAVTTYTANLIYANESGALNESFSDIFGNSIEFENKVGASWKIGEEIVPNGSGLRNMQRPKFKGDPDSYLGQYWYGGTGDNGGVHTNSGVQNYWYYTLCEGDTGTNDNGKFYTVDSIGRQKAQQIAYRSLSTYLSRFSDYQEARYFSILAARDLYGNCSPEVTATTNAWFATAVGPEFDSTIVEAAFLADSFYCYSPAQVSFTNLSTNAISYAWDFGDGSSDTAQDPIHNYLNAGDYSVQLIATNCFGYSIDTVFKQDFISIDSTPDICNALQILDTGVYYADYCRGFIYDAGGESSYPDLSSSFTIIESKGADSVSFSFREFDYEAGYDYLYLYEGIGTGGNLIGKFSGTNLPFGGDTVYIAGENITLRHSSDPAVVGTGFKLWFEAFRSGPVAIAPNDTNLCIGDTAVFTARFSANDSSVMAFVWIDSISNTVLAQGPELAIAPSVYTSYGLIVHDVCIEQKDTAWFHLDLLAPLAIDLPTDTILCKGQQINLVPTRNGGLASAYQVYWLEENTSGDSILYTGQSDIIMHAILSDGCTYLEDTAAIEITVLSPLKIDLIGDTIVCENGKVEFQSIASGGDDSNYTYAWNIAPGINSDTSSTTANAAQWIIVEVQDFCSADKAKDSLYLTLYPDLTIQASGDTSYCYGQNAKVSVSVIDGNKSQVSYLWNTSEIDSSISIDPLTSAQYIVEVNDQCNSQLDTVEISILSPLKLSAKSDTLICRGESLIRSIEATGGRPANYTFTWNDGFTGAIRNWSPIGSSAYQVKIQDACSQPDSIQFAVDQRPALQVDAGADLKLCFGDQANLIASPSGGFSPAYSYLWISNSSSSPVLIYKPAVSEWLVVKLSDNCSPEAIDSVYVEVEKPELPLASLSDSLICLGEEIEINAAGNFANLTFDLSDGTTSSLSPWIFTPSTIGKFDLNIQVSSAAGCKADTLIKEALEVVQPAIANFTLNQKEFILESDQLKANSAGLGVNIWQWTISDGSNYSTPSIQHNFQDTGTYYIQLDVSDKALCTATKIDTVKVFAQSKVWMPNSFTPNGDHFNDTYVPGMLSISSYSLKIYDRWGSLVFECDSESACEWDGTDRSGNAMPAGVYTAVFIGEAILRERIQKSETVLLIR